MNKNLFAILLAVVSLGFLPACGKKDKCCEPKEKTTKTCYTYDECDACYELDAQTSDVESEADMINKF